MDTRVAVIAIIAQTREVNDRLNMVLHEYGEYIIGRMGLPYRERGIHIISIVVDAPQDVISALSGKLGSLPRRLGQGGLRQTGLKGALVMRALMEKLLTGRAAVLRGICRPDRTMAGCGRRRAVRRRPRRLRRDVWKDVYLRGLIEVSNYCKTTAVTAASAAATRAPSATGSPRTRFWTAARAAMRADCGHSCCRAARMRGLPASASNRSCARSKGALP